MKRRLVGTVEGPCKRQKKSQREIAGEKGRRAIERAVGG